MELKRCGSSYIPLFPHCSVLESALRVWVRVLGVVCLEILVAGHQEIVTLVSRSRI
jgi:hypothetical protein